MSQGFKIYTKTGDAGTTSLYTGDRAPKDHAIFNSLGSIDELNAHLGLARTHYKLMLAAKQPQMPEHLHDEQLAEIQARLIDVGSHIATPRKSDEELNERKLQHTAFAEENTADVENWIDQMDSQLPPLRNFILPSGGLTASQLHVARTVCRRAERDLVPLHSQGQIDSSVYTYVNRLSDYLFQLARICAQFEGEEETVYKKARTRKSSADAD